jgi:YVTN family beta-propeller protein
LRNVLNVNSNTVSVIDTATNTVLAAVPVEGVPEAVAVTPDGKHAYVANAASIDVNGTVSVIDTATNTVVATIPAGPFDPSGVAVTPDGKHAYVVLLNVLNVNSNTVSVIDTATNTVVATVTVGLNPQGGVAFTPDGKHAYVTNAGSIDVNGTVSVIDTATNTVVATVTVGSAPVGVGIIPPPPGVPFLAFNAKLVIQFGSLPNLDAFGLGSGFMLSGTAPAINPLTAPVTLQIGTFSTTIPSGSFKKDGSSFVFAGSVGGVDLGARITPTGTLRYTFDAGAKGANLTGTTNPVQVMLTIGDDSGATSVNASLNQ